jgi:integrase
VFANQVGRPIEAQNLLRRSYYPLLESAGRPKLPFHSLRHTCASIALERGVNVKVVSELLGHANPTVTLTVYAHTTLGMHAAASDTIAQALAQ